MYTIRNFLIILLGSLLLAGCLEEEMNPTRVVSEEIVFVSGETAILTGRIISNSELDLSDHGYEISRTEDFSNPLIISLGEKTIPGRFVAETNMLEVDLQYFGRTFAIESGETIYGNTLSFNTLKQVLVNFEPKLGKAIQKMTIEASNLTQDAQVLFNGKLIPNIDLSNESIIEFAIPSLEDEYQVDVKVISQGDTLCFEDQFEYIIGLWENEGPFISQLRHNDPIYLETDDLVAYGMGTAFGSQIPISDFYKLDKATGQWDFLNFPFSGTIGGFSTDKYFGGGSIVKLLPATPQLILESNVYMVEDDITPITTMPVPLYGSIAHLINNKLHIYGGIDLDRKKNNKIFVYDLATEEWSSDQIANFYFDNENLSWTYDGKAYFLDEDGAVIENNPMTGEWKIHEERFPASVDTKGIAVQNGDKVYVGLFRLRRSLYELDMNTFTWKQKQSYSGDLNDVTAAGWSIDDEIFILKNGGEMGSFIWSFKSEAF